MSRPAVARVREVASAVAPLLGAVLLLQLALVEPSFALYARMIGGALLVVAGMVLLFVGIDYGIVPMGRYIGAELPRRRSLLLIAAVAFLMGFATTLAEPDVFVLATQVATVSDGAISSRSLMVNVAVGVGLLTVIALLRVVRGWSMRVLLTVLYVTMLCLSLVAPPDIVPLAYDAGSVTTGVLTAPVILALAIGVSSVLSGRSAMTDGFGLLGLASVGPILFVLALGLVW